MVTYEKLRNQVQDLKKIRVCKRIDRSPVVNEGYPGKFNLSFTEHPWLQEHGRYCDFDHDYVFSTIQSCIRMSDIQDEKTRKSKLVGEDSWKYLGIFEMADLIGMISLAKKTNTLDLNQQQAKAMVELLISLGIDKKTIYPSYHVGGQVRDITQEKYDFQFEIPEDTVGKQALLTQGIPEQNLIPDRTRNTLLCLQLEVEENKIVRKVLTPWGYRNEINVDIGTRENPRFVDIGTLERFAWKPVYDGKKIVDLTDIDDIVSIGAVGLERLCMTANHLPRIQDVDYIKPFYDQLPTREDKYLIGESLRALNRVYTDISRFKITPGKQLKRKRINKLLGTVLKSGLGIEEIKALLKTNAENQPWHPDLTEGVEPTIEEIAKYQKTQN